MHGEMSKTITHSARQQFKFFKIIHATAYAPLIINHVIADASHPLHVAQTRKLQERKKEGLWWHATVGADLVKSSCVRTWARRRLRNAVIEELRARGYDEKGILIRSGPQGSDMPPQKSLDPRLPRELKGSLRLHILPPLIPAKYVEVKAEAGKILDLLIHGPSMKRSGSGAEKKPGGRPQGNGPPYAQKRSALSARQR